MIRHGVDEGRVCGCCGGWLPEEGSEAWEASEGTCPGSVASDGRCGAFDPSLDAALLAEASP